MLYEQYLKSKIKNVWLRYNIQYMVVGLIIGTFLNIIFWLISRNEVRDWRNVVMTYIISTIITLCITNISIISGRIIKKQYTSPIINILMNYGLMALGVLIGSEVSFLFAAWLYDTTFSEVNHWGNIRFNLVFGFLACSVIYLYQLQRDNYDLDIQDKEVQLLKLNEQKTQADLKTLQARINPHFLYNALNSITSLIHDEPAKAEEMTIKLSQLFRYSLNTQEANWALVKEELEIVRTYLDIERVRFGNRITFDVAADESALNIFIPRFLLQPLVENALKHGLRNRTAGGLLSVKIEDKNEFIDIIVHDNGMPFPDQMTVGYGLQSTNDKLNLLYGTSWEMNFINEGDKCIRIRLPRKTEI